VFQGTGGAVALNGPITATSITFNAAGYSVSGNTLTISGATPTITANYNSTINSVLAGNGGLTTAGAGALVLGNNNLYSGGTTISAGTVVTGAAGLGTGTVNVAAGATLSVNGGTSSGQSPVGLSAIYFPMTPTQQGNVTGVV